MNHESRVNDSRLDRRASAAIHESRIRLVPFVHLRLRPTETESSRASSSDCKLFIMPAKGELHLDDQYGMCVLWLQYH